MKKIVMALSMSALVLAGCTTNPYTGQEQAADSGVGAAIGAIVGAGIGALSDKGKPGRGALIGAAGGAAVGGGIGYYLDQQEAKLRQSLEGTGVSVTRYPDRIVLNMPNSLTFDTSSSVLKPFGVQTLKSVAAVLKEYNKTGARIVGYTDSTGTMAINQRLSNERAQSVANALVLQGINAARLTTYGAGPSDPIASNATPEGRAQNRRVEITLYPLQ